MSMFGRFIGYITGIDDMKIRAEVDDFIRRGRELKEKNYRKRFLEQRNLLIENLKLDMSLSELVEDRAKHLDVLKHLYKRKLYMAEASLIKIQKLKGSDKNWAYCKYEEMLAQDRLDYLKNFICPVVFR